MSLQTKLIEADFTRAAAELHCRVAAVKAVTTVESGGAGFDSTGKLVVLFEGHIFHKYTNGRFTDKPGNAGISYARWTTAYYSGGSPDDRNKGEWDRLNRAMALDRKAALYSASYGMFQIMGFNHALCGFLTVDQFVDSLRSGAGAHLDAFVEYVKHVGLDDELRCFGGAPPWKYGEAAFARKYNGPAYQQNRYDEKLAACYKRYNTGLD